MCPCIWALNEACTGVRVMGCCEWVVQLLVGGATATATILPLAGSFRQAK